MKRLLFYVTALLLFAVVGLVYYFNKKKDFHAAAKYMEWGVVLMCAGLFLKMAPTELYGNSGFLRAYILSFALSGVCYCYTLSIVESYKDGSDMPVTIIKQEQIKLRDIGSWTLNFTVWLSLTSNPPGNELELQTDLVDYHLSGAGEFETNKLLPVYDNRTRRIQQTINTQITNDTFQHACGDYLKEDGCFAIFTFSLWWNSTTMNQLRESMGENPIDFSILEIVNPDSETDKIGIIYLPHDEEHINVVYDVTAQQRKKIDGSEKKWLDFSQNNNVAGKAWVSSFRANAFVLFLIQTNNDGEVWATTMEEKPLFSANQVFTSFLAFCAALFAFFSYFFPKTLPKRRVKFSNTKLKFEAQSTFDVLQCEMTQVPEADEEDAKE